MSCHRADDAAAALTILEDDLRPDGIFAFNDLLALGAMHVLVTAGVRVHQDVAVIGFDDIAESRYSTQAPASVSTDPAALARTAIDMLFAGASPPGPHTLGLPIAHHARTQRPPTTRKS